MPKIAFQNSSVPAVTPLYQAPNAEPPMVFFTLDAELTVRHLVREMDVEVAWFGLVRYEEDLDAYVVYKILIPEQKVTAATVDITANAIAQLTGEILDAGDDPSHLRYHGHSHVNMPATPSPTDQEHLSDYLEHADWFIREIRNKKGDSKIDVFDKRQGVVFQCVHRDVYEHLRTEEFYDALDALLDERVVEQHPKPSVRGLPSALTARNFTTETKRQEPRLHEILTYEDLEESFYAQLSDPFFVKGD